MKAHNPNNNKDYGLFCYYMMTQKYTCHHGLYRDRDTVTLAPVDGYGVRVQELAAWFDAEGILEKFTLHERL